MRPHLAAVLLDLDPGATKDQIRAAYLRKAKESHPDLAAPAERERAEAEFKAIAEAYSCLTASGGRPVRYPAANSSAPRPRSSSNAIGIRRGSRAHYALAGLPFVLLVGGTLYLGGSRMSRYKEQAHRHWRDQN